jgi:zinc protease
MRRFFAVVCVLAVGLTARAESPVKVISIEGVTEYRLANGARVLLFPEVSRPTVTVNMTVLVGSRNEGYGETGMAHLLEHMVFKGTPNHPSVPKALRDHGANFNGTTNDDRTNYFETMPANDKNLEFGIALECDRLVNSFIKRDDLISEMPVVRNEFERGENSPASVLDQRIRAAAYEWHNYGKSTIGNRSDIERVPIENLQAFYRKYYQPDNVVLIVAGKFEEPKALALVEKYLGSIPKPDRDLPNAYTEEPAQDGEHLVTLRRVGVVGEVGVAYHIPASSHKDSAPLSLLGGIISQAPNGRLYKALVESKLATNVSGRAESMHDPGLFFVQAACEAKNIDTVRDTMIKTLESLGDLPFTKDEVNKAKVRHKRQAEILQSNGQGMSQALSSAASRGDWRLLFIERDWIASTTAEDVNRVTKAYFKQPNRTAGVYIPTSAPTRLSVPGVPSIAAVVKDYKGGAVTEAGEAFDPTPANLDKRTKIIDEGNFKAGLLAKKNRGSTVSLVLTLHYGNEDSLKGLTTAAGMLPMLMMAGTKKHDRQALREELDALGVRIRPGAGGGFRGGRRGGRGGGGGGAAGQLTFSVDAKRDTLPAALKLLAEILREPAFPEEEFEIQKDRMVQGASSVRTEPMPLAMNRLSRSLSPYPRDDVRYSPTIEENLARVKGVTLDQIKQLYETQIGGSKAELGVVGEFDPDTTVKLVKDILNGWASKVPIKRIDHRVADDVRGAMTDIITPDKENAEYLAGVSFPMTDNDPDYPAMRIANFIFGGSTLASRIGDRIRQKDGLSYGASSSFTASSRDPVAQLTVTVSTNPVNIGKVTSDVQEELDLFLKDGPTDKELADARQAFVEGQKVGRTTDDAIAAQIVSHMDIGRTFAHEAAQEKAILELTPQKVTEAFRKHVDPKKLVIIRAGDFKK